MFLTHPDGVTCTFHSNISPCVNLKNDGLRDFQFSGTTYYAIVYFTYYINVFKFLEYINSIYMCYMVCVFFYVM